VLRVLVEAETDQDTRGARRRGIGVDRAEPLVDLAEPVGIFEPFGLDHQRGALGIGGEHGLERGGLSGGCFLRDIADARAARHVGAALIGIDLAGDHLDQSRLARAVAPDQPDAATRRQRGTGAVDDDTATETDGDGGKVQHGGAPSTPARLRTTGPRSLRSRTTSRCADRRCGCPTARWWARARR
jgi:hypothetical protein